MSPDLSTAIPVAVAIGLLLCTACYAVGRAADTHRGRRRRPGPLRRWWRSYHAAHLIAGMERELAKPAAVWCPCGRCDLGPDDEEVEA